ncbi:MAG TPA: FAD-dependent oxidoreductase [candidate division Zixibacteria bacterium]|nr:FAD-dependent oxidoreductase [candidate division Zixibacteria bacterium]
MAVPLELTLQEVRNESLYAKTFKFSLNNQDFTHQAGQYLTIDLPIDDPRGKRRPFTISSSPTEKEFVTITTRPGPSPFKQALNSLDLGSRIVSKAPFGNFVLPSDTSKLVVMLAGGIGITPFRSMIKFACDTQLPLAITLLYSNRTPGDIPFKTEFDNLRHLNHHFKFIYTVTEPKTLAAKWNGLTGFIDEKMIRENVPDLENSIFYVCGPPGMVEAMLEHLKQMDMPDDRIRFEKFSGY